MASKELGYTDINYARNIADKCTEKNADKVGLDMDFFIEEYMHGKVKEMIGKEMTGNDLIDTLTSGNVFNSKYDNIVFVLNHMDEAIAISQNEESIFENAKELVNAMVKNNIHEVFDHSTYIQEHMNDTITVDKKLVGNILGMEKEVSIDDLIKEAESKMDNDLKDTDTREYER